MLVLFLRGIILYFLIFIVIRLSGKRQVSDLQPFDLVITLLVADLAAGPAGNTSIPLSYGVIPIIALFLIQQVVAYLSLKSEGVRKLMCGKPVIVIAGGEVQEKPLREARYTLNDLLEQLRGKDVFDISAVAYAILETDGSLSVLLKGEKLKPTVKQLNLTPAKAEPMHMLVLDGKVHERALEQAGHSRQWLDNELKRLGYSSYKQLLYMGVDADGKISAQSKERYGGKTVTQKAGSGK